MSKSRKPKIMIAGPYPPPPGGMAVFIENLVHSKLSDDYILLEFDTDYPRWLKKFRPFTVLYLPRMYFRYIFVLLSQRPDVVHVHSGSLNAFKKHSVFVMLAKTFGFAVAYHIHGGKFQEWYEGSRNSQQTQIRKSLSRADILVVLSNKWKKFFSGIYPSDKIHVVENGIPLEKYPLRTDYSERQGNIFIFVGRVSNTKGMDEIIAATSEMIESNPDIHVIVIGGDMGGKSNTVDHYRQKVERVNLDRNITFTGEIPHDQIMEYYNKADIFMLPSWAEGMPLVLLEAMGVGLPCIATNVGAIPEVLNITDSPGGFIIPPKDPGALKSAMLEITGDLNKIEQMGRENRKIIENRFSFAIVAEKIGKIYERLITSE